MCVFKKKTREREMIHNESRLNGTDRRLSVRTKTEEKNYCSPHNSYYSNPSDEVKNIIRKVLYCTFEIMSS